MNLVKKFIFYLKKPKVVIVVGRDSPFVAKIIFQVLRQYLKSEKAGEGLPSIFSVLKKEVFISAAEYPDAPSSGMEPLKELARRDTPPLRGRGSSIFENVEKPKFLLENSSLPILVCVGDMPLDVKELVRMLPSRGVLIFRLGDENIKEISNLTEAKTLSFGFQEKADVMASDISLDTDTNFKINYQGNTVPVWLGKVFDKEEIYNFLVVICVGLILDLNLVEISQALKDFKEIATLEHTN